MSLTNEDLAAIPEEKRVWTTWNYAALWIGMSICIPSYMLASGLIQDGMNWWQALGTIALGNLVVLIPMILNGHAGAKYGIPFPVYARASFGTRGANVPAILRAVVGCGWFGIQTWIGGKALFKTICVFVPTLKDSPWIDAAASSVLHVRQAQFVCFLLFWLVNMAIVWAGIDSIRKLLVVKSFFLPAATAALLFWALSQAGGFGPILDRPSTLKTSKELWAVFLPQLTANVGFWATLSLNIPDFTRYAKNQRVQVTGQAIGLPTSMTYVAFVGIAVTSATQIIYGQAIWDPNDLVDKFQNPAVVAISMFCVVLSTLATNIAANIVSPANDFANLAPSVIGFRLGGLITGIVGIVMCPWKLIEDFAAYTFTWLIAYSALLGPIGGILIADYFLIRRCRLDVKDLYDENGRYRYSGGFNDIALAALALGVLPCIPGFLVAVGVMGPVTEVRGADGVTLVVKKAITIAKEGFVAETLAPVYKYAWFVGFFVAAIVYLIGMKLTHPNPEPEATPPAEPAPPEKPAAPPAEPEAPPTAE